jgi:hypothetical protein
MHGKEEKGGGGGRKKKNEASFVKYPLKNIFFL